MFFSIVFPYAGFVFPFFHTGSLKTDEFTQKKSIFILKKTTDML